MVEICSYAHGAKIHRKTAHLTIEPPLVTQEPNFAVTIHRFEHDCQMRISLYHGVKELLSRHSVVFSGSICTQILSIPEKVEGKVLVILEVEKDDYWTPAAQESVLVLPGFLNRIMEYKRRAEKVEESAREEQNTSLLQSCWAVLAYIEDLLERVKFGESRNDFIVQQKFQALKTKVQKLEEGKDPYIDVTGYQLRGYRSDLNNEIQLYSLYVPKNYTRLQKWPLVVMLHGAWSNHHLALRRVLGKSNKPGENDAAAKRFMPSLPEVPYLVVSPNGFETMSYEGFAEEDVWRVLEEVQKGFAVDDDRIYMTGLSMGGAGAAKLGFRHPDRFAALAIVCGFYDPLVMDPGFFQKPIFSRRLEDVSSTHPISDNILHVPIKLHHGENDPLVPAEGSKKLHNRLLKIGYRSELELYPDVEHEAWEPAYKNARIFEWFSQFKRVTDPRVIRFKCGDSEGGGAYWLHIDELKEIRRFGTVKVEAREDGVYIESKNVQQLSITVPESFYPGNQSVPVYINAVEIYRGPAGGIKLTFSAENKEWKKGANPKQGCILPGRSGIFSAFEDRQIFVHESYGTQENFIEARKLAIQRSVPWAWSDVRWDVIPEDRLTPDIHKSCNLIHFGTTQGSRFIKSNLDKLPIRLINGQIEFAGRLLALDQPVTLIYPNPANPQRYILWNIACTLPGLKGLRPFSISRRSLHLECEGDFIVWSPEGKPLWGGLFDKHWHVEINTVADYPVQKGN